MKKITKTKGKKLGCLILAGAMSLTVAGCNSGKVTEEKAKIKYIMAGPGIQEKSEQVWSEFNVKLHEKLPNITVDFEVIPLSEYKQKVMLMMSAREQMDIVNNYGLDFSAEVTNGSFAEMNDLLDKYGKDVKKALPEWIWDYETVDGKIYGIPTYQMMGQTRCFCFIKEYADKYLDYDGLRNALDSSTTHSAEVYKVLENYCKALKSNGINFKSVSLPNARGYDSIISVYNVVFGDENAKVVNTTTTEIAEIGLKTARDWYEKGYIRKDSLSANDDSNYRGKKDGLAFWDEVYTPYQQENLSAKYGVELVCVPFDTEAPIGGKALAGGTSIMASSKYPEQSMQFLNLIQSDKDYYNFLTYGREGVDYTKIGDDRIETPYQSGQGSADDGYGLYKWIVGNAELAYMTQADPDGYKDWAFKEVNSSEKRSKLIGFQLDTSEISDIITQVDALRTQYIQPLYSGAIEDWEDNYNEYKEKIAVAGDDKAVEIIQKQVDEFLKSKK